MKSHLTVALVSAISIVVLVGCAPERLVGHSYGTMPAKTPAYERAAQDRAMLEEVMSKS